MNSLNSARQKIFLVTGAGKRTALERILHGDSLPHELRLPSGTSIGQQYRGDKPFQQSVPAVLDS